MHALCFEGYGSTKHGKEKHTQTPDICCEALITTIRNDFRGYVGWCATLFRDLLILLDDPAHAKITDLDITIFIQKDIIKFNVSVQHRSAVAMCNTEYDLLEYSSCLTLI